MMESKAQDVLTDSLVNAVVEWLTADNEMCAIRRLDGVPHSQAEVLREKISNRLGEIDLDRSTKKTSRFNFHVVILVKKSSGGLAAGEVDADRATEIRNEVGEVFSARDKDPKLDGLGLLMITTSESGDFSSVGPGTLKSLGYDGALRLAAKHIVERFDLTDYVDVLTETLSYKWAEVDADVGEASEGHASLFAIAASGGQVGADFWRIGLIPDLGTDDVASRVKANRYVTKMLSAPSGKRDVGTRLLQAGVRVTPVTLQVKRFLGTQDLSFSIRWCQKLLMESDGNLTFEKWSLDDVIAGYIDDLKVFPFRDASGAVIVSCRLQQGGDKSHSDPIFAVMKFNQDGEPSKAPTVVLEWETSPAKVAVVDQWMISLVIPEAYREQDQEPLIVKSVKGDKRKANFKIDINREDLPEGVGESGLIVCLEVAGVDKDGLPICFRNSGKEVVVESQEFELRFADIYVEPVTKPKGDNSVSPAEARLAVAVAADLPEHIESFEFKDFARVLEIGFIEAGEKPRLLHSRSIRTVPNLMAVQSRIVDADSVALAARFGGRSGKKLATQDIEFESLDLPDSLLAARSAFLQEVKIASSARGRSLVEVAEWTDALSSRLDDYLDEFERVLKSDVSVHRHSLLRMDTFEIALEDRNGVTQSTIVLPTHPMRAAWIREYTRQLGQMTTDVLHYELEERRSQVDLKLVRRISASNYPFVLGQKSGDLVVYGEEIAFGYGFYLSPKNADYDVVMSMVLESLDAERSASLEAVRVASLSRVVDKFLETKKNSDVLSLMALNIGDGHLVASVLSRFFQDETDEQELGAAYRLMVKCYADRFPYSNPVQKLHELQVTRSGATRPGLSHLAPPIGVSVNDRGQLVEDTDNVHLAVALGIATGEFTDQELRYSRIAHMNGLISGSQTEKNNEREAWFTSVHTGGSDKPQLSRLHELFLDLARIEDGNEGTSFGVEVELSANTKFELRSLHDRADRVVTIDRFVGLDWYEEAQAIGLGATYVLDYTPDFVEGMSDRLIVTTRYRDEMIRVVGSAMREMGLAVIGSETAVINNLGLVSGRLALNLLTKNPQAHEAVGLAVTISYLKAEGLLDGWVVVPVDSHLEVFGIDAQNRNENGRRCDMVLARFVDGCLMIRCIEVKERQGGNISEKLLERIAEQLNNTVEVISNRFLRVDEVRVDRAVQIAHFSSILHHYIDKAHLQGLLNMEQWTQYHIGADNLGDGCYEISREGYVVALQASAQETKNFDGIPIKVLTENDLIGTQFTSSADAKTRSVIDIEPNDSRSQTASRDETGPKNQLAESAEVPENPTAGDDPSKAVVDVSADSSSEPADDGLNSSIQVNDEVSNSDSASEDVSKEDSKEDQNVKPQRNNPTKVEVELGRDLANQVVNWEVSTKGSPHAFILGITGQGKSVTTRHIVNSFSQEGLPAIILDLHGDMAASPPTGAKVIDAKEAGLGFSPFQLSGYFPADINDSAFEIAEIVGYVCDLGEIQTMHVYRGMSQAYKNLGWVDGQVGERLPTMTEFADAVEAVEAGARGKNARERLMPFTDFGLFRDNDDKAFDPTGGGNGLVIDLHGFKNEKVLRAASSFILRKIYREMFLWPQDSTLKIAVVLDEAHRFAKDKTLPKLMKEGRKYGVSCLVASQSISDFDKEVTGNAGTKIVFRTNFPESKKVAESVRGAGKNDLSKIIEQLNVGEAFVATPDHPVARKTRMTGDV
jgi:hypothetical protein